MKEEARTELHNTPRGDTKPGVWIVSLLYGNREAHLEFQLNALECK